MKRFLLLFPLLVSVLVVGQDQPPTGGCPRPGSSGGVRIQTATRAVTKYSGLERDLLGALHDKNSGEIDKTVADDFEVWSCSRNSPMPRADWISSQSGQDYSNYQIRNMAVREFGDIATVSFTLERSGVTRGKPASPSIFIVDVWRHKEGKIAVRYQCEPATSSKGRLQPTGKE